MVDVPSATLAEVEALYDSGRFRAAHEAGRSLGDLRAWPEGRGRILASRIAARLGALRLSQALIRSAFRAAPRDASAVAFYGGMLMARRGPWHGLCWLRDRIAELPEPTADIVALEGCALARLRDFDRAHARLREATRLAPSSPWIAVQRSFALELEDRIDEAVAACSEALLLRPFHRPALLQQAHLLLQSDRHDEAIALLEATPSADESWELLAVRAELHHGRARWAECAIDIDAARLAATLAEPRVRGDLALRAAEANYLLRRHRRAEADARVATTRFARAFAASLAELKDGDAPPRVELSDVPHIRQQHATCAPASLAQIARFHGDPVDHLELAETICYAGTPPHRQRTWATARGYVVREFDFTLDAARALIDARLPFVLQTAGSTWSHAQVVIGYDLARRGLLIRDPGTPSLVELNVDVLLRTQAWHGPRAMLLVPSTRVDALASISLPNAEVCDLRHALEVALSKHDLDAAEAASKQVLSVAPGSLHAFEARLAIAAYRGRAEECIECLDALLSLHPGTPGWIVQRGETMRASSPRAERLAFWRAFDHLDDPALLESLAEDLRAEAAWQEEAARLVRRALHVNPGSGFAHYVYATLGAMRGANDALVLESHRFAVTNDDLSEHFARRYFDFARLCGRDDEALALLEARALRAGARASGPARTLFEIHADQGNPERGVEVLERLARQRPDDGDLLTALVDAHLEAGALGAARECLERARAVPRPPARFSLVEGRLCSAEGKLDDARAALDRGIEAAPHDIGLLTERAHLAQDLEGRPAGIAVLAGALERAPANGAILRELCAWLRGQDDPRARALLERRVAEHPDDQWSRRELALVLSALGSGDEAISVARAALEVRPNDSWAWSILGLLLDRAHLGDEARVALRRAVSLDVDNPSAIEQLGSRETSVEQRREDARYVLDMLDAHVSAGQGLTEAARLAACLPHDERMTRLDRLLERAPHRPDAWEAVARARLEAGDLAGADETSRRACERFPRWFALRLLRAEVLDTRGEREAAERELRELCSLTPLWIVPRIQLSSLLEERGAATESIALVDDGLRRAPRSVPLRLERALLDWRTGERERAFAAVLSLAEEQFANADVTDRARMWARELGRVNELEALLVRRAELDPKSPLAPYRLGLLLTDPARFDDRIAALREAVARSPRYTPALDVLAETLANAERWDEALALCPPPGWAGPTPVTVRGRRAWVRARRGDADAATGDMLEPLADDPSYSWGRRCLCDWLDAAARSQEFLGQARQLVVHESTVALNHVYLGDALLRVGNRKDAIESYDRALTLHANEPYAAERLVELLSDAGRIEDAVARIDRVRHVLPAHEIAKLEIEVATRSGRRDDAFTALGLLLATNAPRPTLEKALGALARSPWASAAFAQVEARLAELDLPAGDALVDAWLVAREKHRPEGALRLLRQKDRLGEAGRAAIGGWITVLADRREWLALVWVWARYGAWLRRDTETWAAYGYALLKSGWYRVCAWWLSDWDGRKGVRPWMLLNLVSVLWCLDRSHDVAPVSTKALELPRDHATDDHRAYLALHSALAGDLDGARSLADTMPSPQPKARGLIELTRALVAACELTYAPDPSELVDAVKEPLDRAEQLARTEGALIRPFRATRRAILERCDAYGRARAAEVLPIV